MNIVCLFGGGRWSRVLLTVLLENYPQLSIIWVTKNNYLQNVEWLNGQKITRVKIIQEEEQAWDLKPEAVIIATASHLHGHYVKQALMRKIPVLSEKPFCYTTSEAQELIGLSKQFKVAAGVNFEFTYASYLHAFAEQLNNVAISSIDIIWQDSFCETRYGEKKIGDIYTPLMKDSFQHCWSMLNFLLPNEVLSISSVSYNEDTSVLLEGYTGAKQVKISLSRRAPQRTRVISINSRAAVLDFTVEPGITTINGQVIQNEWTGNRPLLAVFKSFFAVIKKPNLLPAWPLSIMNCVDAVSLGTQATQLLEQAQQGFLEKRYPLKAKDLMTRNLLMDIFLPKLTAQGEYHRAHDEQEQIKFSEHVIKMLASS